MRKATGCDYYLGTAGMNLGRQVCVLVIACPSPFSVTFWFPVVKTHTVLCNPHGVRSKWGSHKATQNAGGADYPPWVLFSPLRKAEAQGIPLCAMLAWWGAMWSMCSRFSYPSNAVCLGLLFRGQDASATHPCSRILCGVLSLNSWLVVLGRGLAVRNNLCCHLGDVTLPLHLSFNPRLYVWFNLKKLSKFYMERPC